MRFVVTPDIFEQFPGLAVGIIVVSNADNTGTFPEIAEMLRAEEKQITEKLDLETYRDHPHLAALQEVHRSFGNNPNKFPPSIQALCKRILKGGQLPTINPLVDLYNVISLRYVVCAGAEDTDVCEGDIQLTHMDGTEHFVPLGDSEEDLPDSGEIAYKDNAGVICRKLNWREADRTKITEHSKNAVVVLEGFPPFARGELDRALAELAELLQQYCSAETRIEVLTEENPSLPLP